MTLDSTPKYGVVASCKPWGRLVFDFLTIRKIGFNWLFVADKEELNRLVKEYDVEMIFFVHWNWFVPKSITSRIKCLCLHMTDLPYGRGGSPLQNLILRGHTDTKLTIFHMCDELDAGPIYVQAPMSLHGSAHDIYLRMCEVSTKMIEEVLVKDLSPVPQRGSPTNFVRRQPVESEIPLIPRLELIYNFIRMLDAPTYPPAFVNRGDIRISFSNAKLEGGQLTALATFEIEEIQIEEQ